MPLAIGEMAPDISIPTSWGDTLTLQEAAQEKILVITFYFFAFTGG